MRAEIDGSSDKHTGNERERLLDLSRQPLMGSGLTWLMDRTLQRGIERETETAREEQRHHIQRGYTVLDAVTYTQT